ncbi:UPF0496 protein At1g20180 [Ricinus communis]|uniref:UPF0496 protein At1g20180 n=1 Tax=Ricinus communis TaxID=3988 RepID=UPI000772CAB0|nr:UPF0496 protein At1g20180 [Ricinus communis]|eukprot:XP_015577957.1 UPF0496 protein At1g20180 [Ricinus communis]
MWTKFRSSSIRKDGKELIRDGRESLNVNEEYVSALRTQSYVDFFTKAQTLVNESPFPSLCHHKFSEVLLEPGQEAIPAILESATFSKIPELKALMLKYFELSAEASKICSHLLKNINQIQSNYEFIRGAIDSTIDDYSPEKVKLIVSKLNSFIIQRNPFSTPDKNDFKLINDKYSSVLHHLKSKRKKVGRKIRLITCINKASGVCITAACGLIAISAIVIAAHTLTALVMGPAIFSFPVKGFKKKLMSLRFMRSGILRQIGQQLDVAAKGTYILNRDFDTMSRLVARLHDEVEHNKAMIQFCLERREDDKFSLQVMKELKKSDTGFRKQVEELEEHVYLCLLTINRARALVVKEMTDSKSVS